MRDVDWEDISVVNDMFDWGETVEEMGPEEHMIAVACWLYDFVVDYIVVIVAFVLPGDIVVELDEIR